MKRNISAFLLVACVFCWNQTIVFAGGLLFETDHQANQVSFMADTKLHKFSGTSDVVSGHLSLDASMTRVVDFGEVHIPVNSIKTGNDARDHAMQFSLRSKEYPDIVFKPREIRLVSEVNAGDKKFHMTGDLLVAGHVQPVEFDASAIIAPESLQVSADVPLKISQFNLRLPPLAKLIGIKDDLVVQFRTHWTNQGTIS